MFARAIASAAMRRCRSDPTLLRMTPASFTRRIEARETVRDGGRRLRLSADIEHEHERPAERRRDVGRRAAAARLRGDAIEKSHQGFRDGDFRAARISLRERGKKVRAAWPRNRD